MTRFTSKQPYNVPYKNSKLGQQNLIASSRVGIIFTVNQEWTDEIDEMDIAAGANFDTAAGNDPVTGAGFGEANRNRLVGVSGGRGKPLEIVCGGGWRSISVEQQINVTQEGALGFFEIFDTIEHNVAGNTMTCDKMALRLLLLSQSGIAPYGSDVLSSPRLNAYIYDPKERQRGYNFGFLKCIGLHIQTNRWSANVGSAVMENVTFRIDRIKPVKTLPEGAREQLGTLFPSIYSGVENLDQGIIPGVSEAPVSGTMNRPTTPVGPGGPTNI